MRKHKRFSNIVNYGTHLNLCAASRFGDTAEINVNSDGSVLIDVMDRIGTLPRKGQASITLAKEQADELRELLSYDYRLLGKIAKAKPRGEKSPK